MKKFLSVFLTMALCASLVTPAFASNQKFTFPEDPNYPGKMITLTDVLSEYRIPVKAEIWGYNEKIGDIEVRYEDKEITVYRIPRTNCVMEISTTDPYYEAYAGGGDCYTLKNGVFQSGWAEMDYIPEGQWSCINREEDGRYFEIYDLTFEHCSDTDITGCAPRSAGETFYVTYGDLSAYDVSKKDEPQKETTPAATAFTDVKANAYYAAPVKWAVENKVTSGTSNTTFSPDATCTNAQILTFIWRACGSPEATIANPFTNLNGNEYYAKAALWAYEKGMISGTSFDGNQPCTRSMTAEYLWKQAGRPNTAVTDKFNDVPSGISYAESVAWAVENGVTSGTSNVTFSPSDTCTRGQIVTFLYRALVK